MAVTVSMNGVSLNSLSPYIILKEVTENQPSMNVSAVSVASGIGQRVTNTERRYLDVNIKFAINLLKGNESQRAQILNAVNKWAAYGGDLSVSYRYGVVLYVVCTNLIAVGNVKKFNTDYQLTFRAYNVPYWVSDLATATTSSSAKSSTLTLWLRSGNADTPLCAYITNVSEESLTSLSLSYEGKTIALSGISVAQNGTVQIGYDKHTGLMFIEVDGVPSLAKRTTSSADDIWLHPGSNKITIKSNVNCSWSLSAYERWL